LKHRWISAFWAAVISTAAVLALFVFLALRPGAGASALGLMLMVFGLTAAIGSVVVLWICTGALFALVDFFGLKGGAFAGAMMFATLLISAVTDGYLKTRGVLIGAALCHAGLASGLLLIFNRRGADAAIHDS